MHLTIRMLDLAGAEAGRRFSPFCWRTKLALAHKGLAFDAVPWRFTETEALQPTTIGRVPILIDGETRIEDSWAIAVYLEEAYPDRPSLFGGAAAMAVTRFVNQWMDTMVHPLIAPMVVLDIHDHIANEDRAYFRSSREKRFGKSLEEVQAGRDVLREHFRNAMQPVRATIAAGQPFLGGDAPMYADYIVAGGFLWVRSISRFALLAPDDPLEAWRQRMLDAHDGLARKAPGYDG